MRNEPKPDLDSTVKRVAAAVPPADQIRGMIGERQAELSRLRKLLRLSTSVERLQKAGAR